MSVSDPAVPRYRGITKTAKRVAPAFLLLFLAPFIAEYLCGSMGMQQIGVLPVLMLLYGAGAVLIREVTRRVGRGYPTMLLLALGYGILEEGILDQTLFNPHFNGLDLLAYGFVPAIGLAVPWTLYVLTIHVIWSIIVPIVLVEAVSGNRTRSWLRLPGWIVTVVAFLTGALLIFILSAKQQQFMAPPVALLASAAGVVICLVAAFVLPSRWSETTARVPCPLMVVVFGFLASSAFVLLYGQGARVLHLSWPWVSGGMSALILIMLAGAVWIGRSTHGSDLHRVAMAAGALLTYGWLGFTVEPVLHPGGGIGPRVLLVGAMAVVLIMAVRNVNATAMEKTSHPG